MGTTTFSASSKRTIAKRHKHGEYLPVRTGFYTNEGPAKGTLWVDVDDLTECLEVESVTGRTVSYVNGFRQSLAGFMGDVQIGKLILVGVMPLSLCRTEI